MGAGSRRATWSPPLKFGRHQRQGQPLLARLGARDGVARRGRDRGTERVVQQGKRIAASRDSVARPRPRGRAGASWPPARPSRRPCRGSRSVPAAPTTAARASARPCQHRARIGKRRVEQTGLGDQADHRGLRTLRERRRPGLGQVDQRGADGPEIAVAGRGTRLPRSGRPPPAAARRRGNGGRASSRCGGRSRGCARCRSAPPRPGRTRTGKVGMAVDHLVAGLVRGRIEDERLPARRYGPRGPRRSSPSVRARAMSRPPGCSRYRPRACGVP